MEHLADLFYFPNQRKWVQKYVKSCTICQRVGRPADETRAELQTVLLIKTQFEEISIDILGPLPYTRAGRQFILVISDHASRYLQAIPLSNITAKTVAQALLETFAKLGFPKRISSDQGTNFTFKLMTKLCELSGIEKLVSTPYHPQSHGLIERANQTLGQLIRKYVSEHSDQ